MRSGTGRPAGRHSVLSPESLRGLAACTFGICLSRLLQNTTLTAVPPSGTGTCYVVGEPVAITGRSPAIMVQLRAWWLYCSKERCPTQDKKRIFDTVQCFFYSIFIHVIFKTTTAKPFKFLCFCKENTVLHIIYS